MYCRRSWILILLISTSCGRDLPVMTGVDTQLWKEDRNGCRGERKAMEGSLLLEKDKLKGLSETDIIQLLGKPDQNELYKRNQKFYYYFLSAAPGCPHADSPRVRLSIRFNAMGYAQLTSIESE